MAFTKKDKEGKKEIWPKSGVRKPKRKWEGTRKEETQSAEKGEKIDECRIEETF